MYVRTVLATLILAVGNFGCGFRMPNYIPPPSYNHRPGSVLSANGGIGFLSGLHLALSANLTDIMIATANLNMLGTDHMRIGAGVGKSFSMFEGLETSFELIPSLSANFINHRGENDPSSPHLTGVELIPDLQLSFHFVFIELYGGLKTILIPYGRLKWTATENGLPKEMKETHRNPLQVILPAVYGGLSIGKLVYINGGVTYIPFAQRSQEGRTGYYSLREKLHISPLTMTVGLRVVF